MQQSKKYRPAARGSMNPQSSHGNGTQQQQPAQPHQQQQQHQQQQHHRQPPPKQPQPKQPQPKQQQQNNQQRSGSGPCQTGGHQAAANTAADHPPVPLCNMATSVSYPTGANNCEMMGWHVANMDAKLNALFATMSEIFKDAAILAGESATEACNGMQDLIDPNMFTMLQRESDSWDPSVMDEKVRQLMLVGSWIYHRTQLVANKGGDPCCPPGSRCC